MSEILVLVLGAGVGLILSMMVAPFDRIEDVMYVGAIIMTFSIGLGLGYDISIGLIMVVGGASGMLLARTVIKRMGF